MSLLLATPALSVFEHMALDETCVRMRAQAVTLRFYRWGAGEAVTFGYAQSWHAVQSQLQHRVLAGGVCRRPTGGGLVYHTQDLTFSLIFPSADKPTLIYRKLHTALQAALAACGVVGSRCMAPLPAAAYAPQQAQGPSVCFTNPVENDLLLPGGQKMLGGAIRRFGQTVLYQGSLQVPTARENPVLKQAVIQAIRQLWAQPLHPQAVAQEWLAQARALAQTQYATSAWQEKF